MEAALKATPHHLTRWWPPMLLNSLKATPSSATGAGVGIVSVAVPGYLDWVLALK
jgi:hypothetical protein